MATMYILFLFLSLCAAIEALGASPGHDITSLATAIDDAAAIASRTHRRFLAALEKVFNLRLDVASTHFNMVKADPTTPLPTGIATHLSGFQLDVADVPSALRLGIEQLERQETKGGRLALALQQIIEATAAGLELRRTLLEATNRNQFETRSVDFERHYSVGVALMVDALYAQLIGSNGLLVRGAAGVKKETDIETALGFTRGLAQVYGGLLLLELTHQQLGGRPAIAFIVTARRRWAKVVEAVSEVDRFLFAGMESVMRSELAAASTETISQGSCVLANTAKRRMRWRFGVQFWFLAMAVPTSSRGELAATNCLGDTWAVLGEQRAMVAGTLRGGPEFHFSTRAAEMLRNVTEGQKYRGGQKGAAQWLLDRIMAVQLAPCSDYVAVVVTSDDMAVCIAAPTDTVWQETVNVSVCGGRNSDRNGCLSQRLRVVLFA